MTVFREFVTLLKYLTTKANIYCETIPKTVIYIPHNDAKISENFFIVLG